MTPPSSPPAADASRPVETGYVAVGDARLYYEDTGTDGPPLVFVHAGVADHRMWGPQVAAFADRYRVVTYDLRGFGRSELPPQPYAHYRDFVGVLDAVGIESAHCVGASMGGAAVVDVALDQPDRVDSLSLVAPALGGYDFTDQATIDGWVAAETAFEAGDVAEAARIESELWLAGPDRTLDDVDPELRDLVASMLHRSYELATDGAAEDDLEPPAIDRLDELAAPVLLVEGALDRPDMAAVAAMLESGLPDVRTETIADAAHLPSLERPEEFDAVLQAFLDDVA